MKQDSGIKINARGLSNPGPRMMVESALAERKVGSVRVVVSNVDAVDDLKDYFAAQGATVETDQIGADYHLFAKFESLDNG